MSDDIVYCEDCRHKFVNLIYGTYDPREGTCMLTKRHDTTRFDKRTTVYTRCIEKNKNGKCGDFESCELKEEEKNCGHCKGTGMVKVWAHPIDDFAHEPCMQCKAGFFIMRNRRMDYERR